MAVQIIRIIDSNSCDGVLTFKNDNHTNNSTRETKAGRGDRIIWHIGSDSGVASITEILMKPSPPYSYGYIQGKRPRTSWRRHPKLDGRNQTRQ